jgi:hypothetical protein
MSSTGTVTVCTARPGSLVRFVLEGRDRGAASLIANRAAVGLWESFDRVNNSDGTISLRARANNQYVTADNAGAAPLIANRTAIGPWEKFDLFQN